MTPRPAGSPGCWPPTCPRTPRPQAGQAEAAELAALPDAPGPEHIAAFAESARAYGRRLPLSWDLPHHRYRGAEVTVGAMAGAACAEWHLHAWDLARSLGKDYRPADPELVLAAWRGGTPQLWPGPPPSRAATIRGTPCCSRRGVIRAGPSC